NTSLTNKNHLSSAPPLAIRWQTPKLSAVGVTPDAGIQEWASLKVGRFFLNEIAWQRFSPFRHAQTGRIQLCGQAVAARKRLVEVTGDQHAVATIGHDPFYSNRSKIDG